MKKSYIKDLSKGSVGDRVELLGWIVNKRKQSRVVFLDIMDSTGVIQAVVDKDQVGKIIFDSAARLKPESAVKIEGVILNGKGPKEIQVNKIDLVGDVTKQFSPQPRSKLDVFSESMAPHMLSNRHIYLRNPKVVAILQFRDILLHHMRQWFFANGFTSVEAPILTPVPLYHDKTAMPIEINDEKVFLTQCAGYYLESAVHALERVYNIGPSFRGEESRSKRHLMEYWHIKAEIAWANLDDIIGIVESIISYLTVKCQAESTQIFSVLGKPMCTDGLRPPFPRMTYEDAITTLKRRGFDINFGDGLGSDEETELSKDFSSPFWISGIPRTIEPFPYVIDGSDTRITRVADLIATNGCGELLGTAEKISDLQMLDERLKDKEKFGDPRYEFVRDIHQVGCVPHAAFGMGVERLIRWLLGIPHVRDAIPFPRIFRRKISP